MIGRGAGHREGGPGVDVVRFESQHVGDAEAGVEQAHNHQKVPYLLLARVLVDWEKLTGSHELE